MYITLFFYSVLGHFEKPIFLELCRFMESRFVPAGTYLFRIGEMDNSIFVVQSGKLNVFMTEPVSNYVDQKIPVQWNPSTKPPSGKAIPSLKASTIRLQHHFFLPNVPLCNGHFDFVPWLSLQRDSVVFKTMIVFNQSGQ